MKRLPLAILLLTLLPAGQLASQETMGSDQGMHGQMRAQSGAMQSVTPLYEMIKGYITATAEQVPEELYSYRPTDEVRTLGQILGHFADSQYFFCGTVTGGATRPPQSNEEAASKAALVEGLKASFDACAGAYAIDDATAMEEVNVFGQTGTKLWALTYNLTHGWEHYGNLITYMRLNGMVPPSSQGGM